MAKHSYLKKPTRKNPRASTPEKEEDIYELFKVQGDILEKLNRKLNRYGDRLSNHELRIRDIEAILDAQDCEDCECEVEDEAKAKVEAESEPVLECEEPDEEEPKYEGYSGPQLVFFIHGENGKIDYGRPFYNCLVAKGFDPNYKVVPALVSNGKFVRALTRKEYTSYEW